MDRKAKDPFFVLFLALLLPGLGHIYLGKKLKAVIFFLVVTTSGAGTVLYILNPFTRVSFYCLLPLAAAFFVFLFSIADAFLLSRRENISLGVSVIRSRLRAKLPLAGILAVILLHLFLVWFISYNFCFSFTVPAYAMEPSIYPGERVLVDRMAYRIGVPRRGDIVVYRHPSELSRIMIHRVVAFPGEAVELKDHKIFINARPLADAWAVKVRHYNGGKFAKRGMKPVLVPEGRYYILGDNAARSEDSRAWGFLPKDHLIGKAYKIYYPFKRSGPIE